MTKKGPVLLLGLLGAALTLIAAGRVWARGALEAGLVGGSGVSVSGSAAVSGMAALALAAGAGVIALAIAGTLGRRIVGAVIALAGLGLIAMGVSVLRDPARALSAAAAQSTGMSGAGVTSISLTLWPWITMVGAAAVTLCGVLAFVRSPAWQASSQRYQTSSGATGEPLWDALSRGEDPTDQPED